MHFFALVWAANTLRFKSQGFLCLWVWFFVWFVLFSHSSNLLLLIFIVKAVTGFPCLGLCSGGHNASLYSYFKIFFVETVLALASWWGRKSNVRQVYDRMWLHFKKSFVSRVYHGWHWKCRLSGNHRKNHEGGLTKCWLVKSSLLNLGCPSLTSAFFFKNNTFFSVGNWVTEWFCDYCSYSNYCWQTDVFQSEES